jgi:hypothetical protein
VRRARASPAAAKCASGSVFRNQEPILRLLNLQLQRQRCSCH